MKSNDFLPHLPGFDIRQGGIDCLIYIYKYILPHLQGYITNNGQIDLLRLDIFLNHIAKIEESLLNSFAKDKEYQIKRDQFKIQEKVRSKFLEDQKDKQLQ